LRRLKPSSLTIRLNSLFIRSQHSASQTKQVLSYDTYPFEKSIQPLLILPGLYGSKQNWRTICKRLPSAVKRSVYAMDLVNHGESYHTEESAIMDYFLMADDVWRWVKELGLKDVAIMGHSMGGKTAMVAALKWPELFTRLIVVDIAPVDYRLNNLFEGYTTQMKEVEKRGVSNRQEADKILQETIPEQPIRQFLLTNLKQALEGGHMKFRVNLKSIEKSLPTIMQFPYTYSNKQIALNSKQNPNDNNQVVPKPYLHKTIFIGGSQGRYIKSSDTETILGMFPRAKVEMLDCGHWIHAEKPEEFEQILVNFFSN